MAIGCAVGVACATNRSVRRDEMPCPGVRSVDVTNNRGALLDVYTYVGSSRTFVGTARRGITRLTLPPGAGRFVVEWSSEDPNVRRRSGALYEGVRFRTVCEGG
jgi:hypothetical protein